MSQQITISSVEFKNFKALKNYSIRLQHMNILVGPNNTGKSTIISAFRALGVAIRQGFSKKASLVEGPVSERYGYPISDELLPMSLENVHTDYAEVDSTVTFKISNGNKLILFFPSTGGCNLLTETSGRVVTSPAQFKREFPLNLEIVPILGPLEQNEKIVSEETVRKGSTTHRASRHFRNYWTYFPDGFEEFAEMVAKTWPGMTIDAPKKPDMMTSELIMFCNENRIPRELYWSGFGFQVWCQLLTHISRCKNSSILIVDEPEVYLHPDVQRQLLGILRYSGPDIIIATHSTEIMSEADASEILLINKSKRSASRLKDIEEIQIALDAVGSIQNVTLTHLAKTGRMLFFEGEDDYKIIRRFARHLGLTELSTGNDITAIKSGGFSAWQRIKSFSWGFKEALKKSLHIGAVFDRDYWSDEELNDISLEISEHLELSHIHKKKEIENYLLTPDVLERALKKSIRERERRTGTESEESENVFQILDRITLPMKSTIQGQYVAKRVDYLRVKYPNIDSATLSTDTIEQFEQKWRNLVDRMDIVPGKIVLRQLREEIQKIYSVSLTDVRIIDEYNTSEIPEDLRELLFKIEDFRNR